MPGLLYFLPERRGATAADAVELGLGYAFDDGADCSSCSARGPNDLTGVVIGDATRSNGRVGYYPDRQTWTAIPGNPAGAWVGRPTDQAIGPDDLVRPRILPGHPVRLVDGNEWVVPIARGLAERDDAPDSYALPRRLRLDGEGNWTAGDVLERYAGIWDIASGWWDAIMLADKGEPGEDAVKSWDLQKRVTSAVALLAANYRVGPVEASILGLFDDASAVEVLQAAIDWPTVEMILQKKTDAEADSRPDE